MKKYFNPYDFTVELQLENNEDSYTISPASNTQFEIRDNYKLSKNSIARFPLVYEVIQITPKEIDAKVSIEPEQKFPVKEGKK